MHRRILGLVGSSMLALGALYAPIVQIPLVGSLTYTTVDRRGAMILLALGLLGAIGSVLRAGRLVMSLIALVSLATLALTYFGLHATGVTPSHGLGGAMASALVAASSPGWGVAVLLVGAGSVAASTFVSGK